MIEAWSDEDIETMKREWGNGSSARQIADMLSVYRSRNAVIGKIHRLGLSGSDQGGKLSPEERAERQRATNIRRSAARKQRQGRSKPFKGWNLTKPAEAKPPITPNLEPTSATNVHISELDFYLHCRFVIGEPTDFMYCGAPRLHPDHPTVYCHHHYLRSIDIKSMTNLSKRLFRGTSRQRTIAEEVWAQQA